VVEVILGLVVLTTSAWAQSNNPNLGTLVPNSSASGLSHQAQPDRLPIFRLSPVETNEAAVKQLALKTLGISGEVTRNEERLILRSGAKVVEMFISSGAVWVADEAQLWNPELNPGLPDEEAAQGISEEFFANKLLPSPGPHEPFAVSFANMGATYAAFFDSTAQQQTTKKLDVQVNYSVQMQIPMQNGSLLTLPIVGGGGEFNLTFGNNGILIGHSGLWRPIEGVEVESRVIPREEADKQFKHLVQPMEILSFEAFLAAVAQKSPCEGN
jgi:hypothetical protein